MDEIAVHFEMRTQDAIKRIEAVLPFLHPNPNPMPRHSLTLSR